MSKVSPKQHLLYLSISLTPPPGFTLTRFREIQKRLLLRHFYTSVHVAFPQHQRLKYAFQGLFWTFGEIGVPRAASPSIETNQKRVGSCIVGVEKNQITIGATRYDDSTPRSLPSTTFSRSACAKTRTLQPQSDLFPWLHRSCQRPYSRESHPQARSYRTRYLSQVRGTLH